MKTNSNLNTGLLNTRLLLGFALFSVGLLMALAGLSESVSGTIAATPDGNTHHRHHHYELIDLETFGGPQSYVAGDGNGGSRVLNNRATLTGTADTHAPTPGLQLFVLATLSDAA